MVHPGGFEPPTARFVAEYSIQLSYGCIGITAFTADSVLPTFSGNTGEEWCIREDDSPKARPKGPLLSNVILPGAG